jgi:hypothetical protein
MSCNLTTPNLTFKVYLKSKTGELLHHCTEVAFPGATWMACMARALTPLLYMSMLTDATGAMHISLHITG